jgi:hypothetical protein
MYMEAGYKPSHFPFNLSLMCDTESSPWLAASHYFRKQLTARFHQITYYVSQNTLPFYEHFHIADCQSPSQKC